MEIDWNRRGFSNLKFYRKQELHAYHYVPQEHKYYEEALDEYIQDTSCDVQCELCIMQEAEKEEKMNQMERNEQEDRERRKWRMGFKAKPCKVKNKMINQGIVVHNVLIGYGRSSIRATNLLNRFNASRKGNAHKIDLQELKEVLMMLQLNEKIVASANWSQKDPVIKLLSSD